MAETVGTNTVGAFSDPVNGNSPVDADEVRANDNALRTAFNTHESDGGTHLQSSPLAGRPAAGTAGRKWLTSDGKRLYYDTGSAWEEVDYLSRTAGGTVGGATTFSGGLTSSGATTLGATTFTGAISGTTAGFSGAISAAGATLTAGLTGTSAAFSGNVSMQALTATTGAFSSDATVGGTLNVTGPAGLAVGGLNNRRRLVSQSAELLSVIGDSNAYCELEALNLVSASGLLAKSRVPYGNSAGSATATMTNAPTAGNPSRWLAINDNGTTRFIPAW